MKLGSIPDPFAGEKLAEIYPRLAPFIDPERTPHLGRLHYFPGRHLTSTMLGAEQEVRVKRLALRGRATQAGVVSGLELTWRTFAGGVQFQLSPGHALAATGHDIVVDRAVDFAFEDLKLFDADGNEPLLPLALQEDDVIGPFVGVLVLQPGFVDDADRPENIQDDNQTDFAPCPRVPADEVYFKTTSTDAARLILVPFPFDGPFEELWQNSVAWSIFNDEAAGVPLPWTHLGIPLAAIGFNSALMPAWIDRHAVVRPAGKPRQRALIEPTFDARVWHARFDQFCAQLSEIKSPLSAGELCQFLPPIGLLPRTYLDLAKRAGTTTAPPAWLPTQHFFPNGYTVDVSVIPLEQLDALLADTVRLQPYDLSHLDAVRLLLPIPQQWFDPDLLNIEVIDPKFAEHIATYRTTRGKWLADRSDLAQRRHALELSLGATPTAYPLLPDAADPKRLESPEQPISAPPGNADQYEVRRNTANPPAYSSLLLTNIRTAGAAFLKTFTVEDQNEFKELFKACGITTAEITAAFAPAAVPSWLAGFSVDTGADATLDENERKELRRELLAYIKKQTEVQAAEAAKLATSNLNELIAYFDARADEADELVDAGFLKARTDVFRLGTLLSNNSLATKFVASPSLANVVDRKPAKADTAGVNKFASQLLANFAPSAIGSTASPTTSLKTLSFKALSSPTGASGGTDNALVIGPNVGSTNLGKTFDTGAIIGAIANSGQQIEQNRNTLDSIVQKLEPAEQEAFNQLRTTAEGLTSAAMLNQLQGVAEVGKFADNFVANFDQLSQKQIRAIPLDRLQPALAPTVRREIHDGRLEIFERLTRLGISLGDLTTDFVDVPGTPVRPPALTLDVKLTRLRFQTLISRRRFDSLILIKQGADNTGEASDADESKHFSTGVSYADMAMSALRAVESRIKEYRAFIAHCRAAQVRSEALIKQLTTALAPIELELEEARQDVAVALALRDEEQARLDRINAHREKVLSEHVEFLVFHRPRAVVLNISTPSRVVEPALLPEPVLECLRENPTPPADLGALRDIFRASPARWFKHAPKWIAKIDRWEHLRATVERAAKSPAISFDLPTISAGRYAPALNRVFSARHVVAQKFIAALPAIDIPQLAALSWRDLRDRTQQQLTLGQLITAGPAPLAKAAAEELENIFAVTTCLHENFSRVPGLVRLDWAEKFGQFDNVVVDFRDLSRLPGWRKIDFTLRREMQLHADWIFARIDDTQPDALDLINDLLRVALLLASHAPVDQLVVGHPIETEVTPRPGLLLNLKVDPLRIRRGMTVTYKVSETQTLRAVVEDISSSHVAARVLEVPALAGATLKLTPASTFYFK